jgi:hypothetical protein
MLTKFPGIREHRRDAYDTLGLATCVALRPSEKYHRRPACAAECPRQVLQFGHLYRLEWAESFSPFGAIKHP